MDIIGLKGNVEFGVLSEHLRSKGAEAVLMDTKRVFGRLHVISAMEHAKRSFANGNNRSKTLITEFFIYMAGERQITKALEIMTPKGGQKDLIVLFLNGYEDSMIKGSGMKRCDELIQGNEEKAKIIGLEKNGQNISYEDLVLEMVAMVDIQKK